MMKLSKVVVVRTVSVPSEGTAYSEIVCGCESEEAGRLCVEEGCTVSENDKALGFGREGDAVVQRMPDGLLINSETYQIRARTGLSL